MARTRGAVLAAVVAAVVGLAGCSGGQSAKESAVAALKTVGPTEGTLNLLSMSGYTEYGGSDPRVDWVTPFHKRTRCTVNITYADTPERMLQLFRHDDGASYDGVVAPPEVAGQLIAEHLVAPINPKLVTGFKEIPARLRGLPAVRAHGRQYGVPYVWSADTLVYDPREVHPAPTGWAALFDPARAARYRGRLVMRDSPLTIADAALDLRASRPDLKISDPYALTRRQFDAALALLKHQRPYVAQYWTQPADAIEAFAAGGAVLGQMLPYHLDVLSRAGRSVAGVTPAEGTTGSVYSWLVSARAAHPDCMYEWLSWVTTPSVQQQVAEWMGVAPANPDACDLLGRRFCTAYHVKDSGYLDHVFFARVPTADCGTAGRGCVDYATWTRSWNQIVPPPG